MARADLAASGRRMLEKETSLWVKIVVYFVMITFTFVTVYPLLWLIMSSFKTTQEFQLNRLGLPIRWYVENYPAAWRIGEFTSLFANSVFYTVVSTVATIILALAAGFAFAKLRSKATPILQGSFIVGILLTIQSILVPLFLVSVMTGLYNTRLGVIIPYVGIALPIAVYLCTEFIKAIPDSIIESARIDGAGYLMIFRAIIMPMAKPVATTLAILNVTGVWNEFILINIFVSKNSLKSLPVGILKFSGTLTSDYGKQFAALTIGMVPMIIFYLIFRNQITKGVSAGAVKG